MIVCLPTALVDVDIYKSAKFIFLIAMLKIRK